MGSKNDCTVELFHSFMSVPCWLKHILVWINQHQTLITGGLALLAAWWTVRYIRKQLKQSELQVKSQMAQSEKHVQKQMDQIEKHKDEDKKARNVAARAGMPKALSDIHGYIDNCLKLNWEVYEYWKTNKNLHGFNPKYPFPDYPLESFDKVQSIIGSADKNDARVILDFINWAQVHRVRLEGWFPKPNSLVGATSRIKEHFHSSFFDTLVLKKFADRIFPYARYQSENIGEFCTAEEALNDFIFFNIQAQIDDDLLKYIEKKWPPKGLSRME